MTTRATAPSVVCDTDAASFLVKDASIRDPFGGTRSHPVPPGLEAALPGAGHPLATGRR
jgi:hypothetical protein